MKFRVWSRTYKRYFIDGFLIDSDGYLLENQRGELINTHPNDWIVEYSTGLFDLKGTEIYCADIVKAIYSIGTDCVSGISETYGAIEWDETDLQIKYAPFDCALNYFESFEIIGNIHQNPELLQN